MQSPNMSHTDWNDLFGGSFCAVQHHYIGDWLRKIQAFYMQAGHDSVGYSSFGSRPFPDSWLQQRRGNRSARARTQISTVKLVGRRYNKYNTCVADRAQRMGATAMSGCRNTRWDAKPTKELASCDGETVSEMQLTFTLRDQGVHCLEEEGAIPKLLDGRSCRQIQIAGFSTAHSFTQSAARHVTADDES